MSVLGNLEKKATSGRAEAAITSKRFLKQGAAVNGITPCSVAGEYSCGVSKFDALSGDVTTYHQDGDLEVTASAAIALGAEVSTTNVGKAKTAVSTEHILGYAMNATSADGDIVVVRRNDAKTIKA